MRCIGYGGIAAALLAAACSGDSAGPLHGISVSITVHPDAAQPGDTVRVRVNAAPLGDAKVAIVRLSATGFLTASDSVQFASDGPQVHTWTLALPYLPGSGDIALSATAQGGSATGSDQDTVAVADLEPPELTAFDATPILLAPTDTITVTYSVHDNAGVYWSLVRISGAFTATDSVDHAFAKQVNRTVRIPVPASTPLGSTFTVKVIASDPALHRDSAIVGPPIQVEDRYLPIVTGSSATGPEPGLTFVPNDTLRLQVNATDNYKLAWLGYRIGPPASLSDSVAVTGRSASHSFSLLPSAAWIGAQSVTVFARDSEFYVTNVPLGTATVVPGRRRPTQVFPLAGAIPDLVYDSTRDVVYFTEPSLSRVRVFSLATQTFATPIKLFGRPYGLDVTQGGDSLLVALGLTTSLAIVDLQNGQVDTANFPLNPNVNPSVVMVRALANGRALATTVGIGGGLWELDLSTLDRRPRGGAYLTEIVPMARSGDGSHLLLIGDNACCPETGSMYRTATDTFDILGPTADRYGPKVSADRTGSRFLVDESLFDGNLNLLRTFTSSTFALGSASAIAADGLAAYLAFPGGYLKVRTSDGVVLDTVRTGKTFFRFIAVSSGAWLVGVSGNPQLAQDLVVVDLR